MNWSVGKGATAGFALAVAVLLASAVLSYRNIRRIAGTEALVVHTHQVLVALRETLATLVDAETGQRGYIITGETPYLEPYRAALQVIRQDLDRIQSVTRDNPDQQRRFASLQQKTAARLETLRAGITARDEGGPEGGRRFILAGRGKREMGEIRGLVKEMEQAEMALLDRRRAGSQESYRAAIGTVLVSSLLGLGLVATAFALSAREAETSRRSAQELSRANDALEERVRERTANLATTNEALQRSNRELEQFASVASHDLQEPLRKIQAFGDRLSTRYAESLGDQGREYVERMQASAGRMRNLIDALLTFSRVTTKAQPFVPVDLAAAAREAVVDLEDRIQKTGGRVELGPLGTIEADPIQMRQLFLNLVGNGLKFHRAGEPPVVRVEGRLVEDAGDGQEDPRLEIAVRDNGIGFEEIYLDRIFEVFQRLHGRQEYEGTGVGLAICRKIVERHNGTITARSSPDQGATFLVALPVRRPREENA